MARVNAQGSVLVCWSNDFPPLLRVDYKTFASPNEKFCGCNFLVGFLVIIPGNNGRCSQAPVDEVVYESDYILIIEAP